MDVLRAEQHRVGPAPAAVEQQAQGEVRFGAGQVLVDEPIDLGGGPRVVPIGDVLNALDGL